MPHSPTPSSSRSRVAELHLRHGDRLSAYIAARLGRDHYRYTDLVSHQVWAAVGAAVDLVDGQPEFSQLAEVARRVIVRHHLAARKSVTVPPVVTPLPTVTRLGAAA